MVLNIFLEKVARRAYVQVLAVLLIVVVASCSSSNSTSVSHWNIGDVKNERLLTAEQENYYNSLYSAAINERLMEHYDAAYVILQQALSVKPHAPEALYEMAMLALHYGDESGTVRIHQGDSLLHLASTLAPDNLEYLHAYGMALAEKEDFAKAISVYEKLIAKKETSESLSELLNLYRVAKREDEALQVLNRLEQLEGPSNDIYFERYRIFIAQKDTAKAFKEIDKLCASNSGDLYFVALKANLYHEQGYNDKALSLFQQVLKKDPKQSYARVSLLSFYRTLHEEKLYQQLFNELVDDVDLETEVRDNIMRQFYVDALQSKKDTAEVLPVVRRVLALPQESRVLGEMTLAYLSEIHYPRKSMAFVHERILSAEPDYNVSRLELIFANVEDENRMKVHQLCEEGRKYAPGQVAYYIYDALALNEMNREQEAISVLEEGEAKADSTTEGEVRSQMVALLGDFYHEAGEVEKAYAAYDKAIAYDGTNLLCLNNYAYFLSKENKSLDKAESMSKITIDSEPDNPTYLDTYAWILYKQENYTQAKIYIDETLKYSEPTPENVTLFDHAGDIYYHCGEKELAMGFWKKALKLAEDADMKQSLKKKIRRGRP